ncbi:MAG: efflux RND transporter permease subunit [Bacteroidales bacterium]|nr:efflux RND transporter permease subunit [Bacteroidales bacterium]
MKKIVSAFVKYPFYGKIFIVVLLLIGGISLMNIRKASFPIVESTSISISVSYPGATPKQMEEGVTTLIENAIRGIPGIKEFSSKSVESMATVTITAFGGYDMDELLSDVKNSVDGISNFPAAAQKPIIKKGRTSDMAMFVVLKSTKNDLFVLNSEANRIEDAFLSSGKISQVTIMGVPSNMELVVEIKEDQLRRYNLDISTIQAAISANNLDIHGGTIKNGREEIKVVSRQRTVDPDELKKIVIRTNSDGKVLRIEDVANVKLDFAETPNVSYADGEQAVSIMISKLETEDLQEISKFVKSYIEDYNKTHEETELSVTHDFLDTIDNQLSTLVSNGVLGVFLIIVLLSLLLNFRLSLWVAWGIPAAFLGMFIITSLSGITINIISLYGMILIIGILVDDGVVIGESIFTHYEMGKSPKRAAIDGTMEVLPAVFTSVLTTMIAFTPLFFIEGNLKMMYEMAFIVVAVLVVSLFEAIFVLPGHLANPKVLKPTNTKSFYGKIKTFSAKLIKYLNLKIYQPLLSRILKNKAIALSVVAALVILTVGMFMSGKIAFVFFSASPADMFSIDLALKPGVSDSITKEKLFFIEDMVWEANAELKEEYGDTSDYISQTQITIGSSFSGTESGTNAGMIRVFLNSFRGTKVTEDIIKQRISEKTSNIPETYKYGVGASSRFGAPISYSLLGYDSEEIELAQQILETELNKVSSLYNISNNAQLGSQELKISLKPEAYIKGLTQSSLMNQVRSGFYGSLAQRMQEGKNEIWVYVRYPLESRITMGQLEQMMINTPQGSFPLETLVNIETDRSLNAISRYNGQREIRVDAYMKDQNEGVTPIISDIEERVIPMIEEQCPGVSFQKQGQQKDSQEQMQSMGIYFGIAFLIIVIIIMIYFKSFSQGLLVVAIIPLGILGAIWGHGIHGQPVSMMSLWGFVALAGTVINGSIVFISKYNSNLTEGMIVKVAVVHAGKSRFRAIFLTTVTTFVGLMPLILVNNPDSKFLVPMSISLAYGILFGTIFILLILPVMLILTNKVKLSIKKLLGNKEATPESVEVAIINQKIDENLQNAMEKEF